jgi:hypothetical protein
VDTPLPKLRKQRRGPLAINGGLDTLGTLILYWRLPVNKSTIKLSEQRDPVPGVPVPERSAQGKLAWRSSSTRITMYPVFHGPIGS